MKTARKNALKGVSAEALVSQKYQNSGFDILARNYRKPGVGEIDIVAIAQSKIYFVECKSSTTFEDASRLLNERQRQRMHVMAQYYLAHHQLDQETELRFDAALVDAFGNVSILPGALN